MSPPASLSPSFPGFALSALDGQVAVTRPGNRKREARAMDRQAVRDLISEIFEEEALLFGGIVAVHPVEDEIVWRFVRGLDGLRHRFLRRIEEADPGRSERPACSPRAEPHPAIERFLRSIREEAEVAGR